MTKNYNLQQSSTRKGQLQDEENRKTKRIAFRINRINYSPRPATRKQSKDSPFRVGDGAEGPGSAPEVGTLDPVGLVLEVVTRQTPRVGRVGLPVHDLQGSSGVRSVAEVLIAWHAPHAGGEDRGPRGGAR